MEPSSYRKKILSSLALTVVFDTIIALFLTLVGIKTGFWKTFLFSQSIGLCMCSAIMGGHFLARRASIWGQGLMLLVTMPVGAMAGTLIGCWLVGLSVSGILEGGPAPFFQVLLISFLFGTVITYFFFSRERISRTEAELHEEQIRRLTLEKKTLETHLRLLQAQIEPHFLFNSLSNILSLLETDPVKGRAMLLDLTRYLRASLSRTREKTTTLGEEMELVRAYLDIQKVRMGERLRYHVDMPAQLGREPFPPMLVQPIVENAVKHGLEPKVDGGAITIRVEPGPESLRLAVEDTGCGLAENAGDGVGLSNVRERLEALYNGKGRLTLQENSPSGLKVTLEIPNERDEGDHRR